MAETAALHPQQLASIAGQNWSQLQETVRVAQDTVRMLNLAVAQIEVSMRDGDDSVDALTNSFTSMAGGVQVIERAAREMENAADFMAARDVVAGHCAEVSGKMQAAIVAFQFYDKLTQRLSHVRDSLAALGTLVDDPERVASRYEWYGLQEKIRSKYSMEEERAMFDALMNGATVEAALELGKADADDDVELF